MRTFPVLSSVAVVGLLVACGGGEGASGGDAAPAPDASGGTDARAGTDAPPAGRTTGLVSVTRLPQGLFLDGATFATEDLTRDPCAGSIARAGDCCGFAPDFELPPEALTRLSAGTVQVRDTTSGDAFPTLTPGDDASYFGFQWTTPAWTAGDVIEAIGAGADVPAFTVSGIAPGDVAGLVPAWDADHEITIDHTRDFELTWTPGGTPARMELLVLAEENGNGYSSHGAVFCEVDDTAGALTIPAALMATFESGDLCAVCGLTRVNTSTIPATGGVALVLSQVAGGGGTFE